VARTIGAKIAKIAGREEGKDACGPNNVDGGGYCSSCDHHHPNEDWCSDFARWVWYQARVLYTDELTPESGRFGIYGRKHGSGLHRRPRVGDAVLFNYDGHGNADHVAIVVRVFPNGDIASIGGNELSYDYHTSHVHRDSYSGAIGYSSYWSSPKKPYKISGYVSPVEDDMPYPPKKIRRYAGQGVANELKTDTATRDEIKGLVKQGVADELRAAMAPGGLLAGIVQQVSEIHDHVIPPPPPPPTGTRPTPP
jgi:CHAP domain